MAGSASRTIYGDEAVPASAVAQVLRRGPDDDDDDDNDDGEGRQTIDHGVAALPHDKVVPVASFVDDVKRKVALRKVMFDMKNPEKQKQAEALVTDDTLQPGQQWDKDDTQVNYRYSGNPVKSCGVCTYFIAPGECEIVAGLIRPVDVCDQFEPLEEIMQRAQIRPSQLVTQDYLGEVAQVVLARQLREQYGYDDDYDDDDAEDCSDDEKDANGHCPDDPEFDDTTAGLYDQWGDEAEGGSGSGPQKGGDGGVTGIAGKQKGRYRPERNTEAEGGPGSGPQPGKGKKYPVGPGTGSRAANKATVRREDEGGPAVTGGMKTHLQAPGGTYGMKTREPDFRKLWDKAVRDPKFAACVAAAEDEVSPPGWSGSVKAMKKHPKISNPWALAWWMRGRGAQSHYPPEKTTEGAMHKEDEGGPGSGPQKGGGKKGGASTPAGRPAGHDYFGGFSGTDTDAATDALDQAKVKYVVKSVGNRDHIYVPTSAMKKPAVKGTLDYLRDQGYQVGGKASESLVTVDLSHRVLENMIRASAAKLVGGG